MIEGEGTKFNEEGKAINTPFTVTLRCLALSRGFKSQYSLSKALGKENTATVNSWYRGRCVPGPGHFGSLLVLFQPYDEKLEKFVEVYSQEIVKRRRVYEVSIDTRLKISKSNIDPSYYPVGQWIENYVVEKGITLRQFFRAFGFSKEQPKYRDEISLDSLSWLLQNAQQTLDLSEDQIESLSEAVVLTIQQKLKEGHRFQDGPRGRIVNIMQEGLEHKTYNGAEVAKELSVSRERVSKLRKRFKLPLLLTEQQVEELKTYFAQTEDIRKRQQEIRKQKQAISESSSL